MSLTTPLDIIKLALKDAGALGVGQTPLDEDVNDAFDRLNGMMATWARKRWLVYRLETFSKISTGAQSYSVGPGGDFDIIARPDRIESAFIRQNPASPSSNPVVLPVVPSGSPYVYIAPSPGTLTITGGTVSQILYSSVTGNTQWVTATSPVAMDTGDAVQVTYTIAPTMSFTTTDAQVEPPIPLNAVDQPIRILQSREDYNRISLKALQTFTYSLFYDPGFPLGTIWPYPSPNASLYGLYISVKLPMTGFANLSDPVDLPPEYKTAILYNLADRLRSAYQIPIPPNDKIVGWARDALNVIRGANTAIPTLTMPATLPVRRGTYNIYSDQG